jgi:hypothetical protein
VKLLAHPINCTLKADPAQPSSTDAMIAVLAKSFQRHDAQIPRRSASLLTTCRRV